MLGKVLKYDLKSICKKLIPLYVVSFYLSLVVGLLSFFNNVFIGAILYGFINLGFTLISILLFLLTIILSIKYYLENFFGTQGYLTHTLPVKKGTLLLSKVLASLITFIMTFGVVVISSLIAHYNVGLFYAIIEIYKFLLIMFVYGLIAYLMLILMAYASIAIGFSRSSNKIVTSVVCAVVFYFIMEILYLSLFGIIMIYNPTVISNLDNNTFMFNDLINTVFMIFTVLLGGVYYYISYRFINKKLNLE